LSFGWYGQPIEGIYTAALRSRSSPSSLATPPKIVPPFLSVAPAWNRRQLSQPRMAAKRRTRRKSRVHSINPEFTRGCTRIDRDEAVPMQPRAYNLRRLSKVGPAYAEATASEPAADYPGDIRPKAVRIRSALLTADFADKADEADQPRMDTKDTNERAPESLRGRATTDAYGSTRMTRFRCSRRRSPRTIPGEVLPKAVRSPA
jgi:hypothetical protein